MIGCRGWMQRYYNVVAFRPRPLPTQTGRRPNERKGDIRVISDFITGDIPIRDKAIVGVGERCIVRHGRSASVGVFALCEKLVDGIQVVRLDSVVGGKYNELRDLLLRNQRGISNRV